MKKFNKVNNRYNIIVSNWSILSSLTIFFVKGRFVFLKNKFKLLSLFFMFIIILKLLNYSLIWKSNYDLYNIDHCINYMSPLVQFDILDYFIISLKSYDISMTNVSITWIVILISAYILLNICFSSYIIPKAWQKLLEFIFVFILNLVRNQLGNKGLIYFPFMFSLFTFILLLNLLSLLPYGFAATSHFIWTLYFSFSICLGIFFLGLINFKMKFLKLFVPGVPFFLYFLMIPIELLSYILRSFSLAIRLSANIISGHILVHIIADAILLLLKMYKIIVIIPIVILVGIFMLELGIACLQAYIFVTLVCMYFSDSINFSNH